MTMPALKRTVPRSFDDVLAAMPEALKAEGFGLLTEADVAATLKKKIDVDFRRYRIFGACDPAFAHQALEADADIGVLLPCNVVAYENDDGSTTIAAVDPVAAIGPFGGEGFDELARVIQSRLQRVVDSF